MVFKELLLTSKMGGATFNSEKELPTLRVPRSILKPETHEQRPINPYGPSKMVKERMRSDFAQTHGLRFVALRHFNSAGGDPCSEIGERHGPEANLITLALGAGRDPGLIPQYIDLDMIVAHAWVFGRRLA